MCRGLTGNVPEWSKPIGYYALLANTLRIVANVLRNFLEIGGMMTKSEKEIARKAFVYGRIWAENGKEESPYLVLDNLRKLCDEISKKHRRTANKRN
jgi:hypothetical protein